MIREGRALLGHPWQQLDFSPVWRQRSVWPFKKYWTRQSEGWNRPFVGMGLWPEEEVEGEWWWWWWVSYFLFYNRLCFLTDTFNYICFHFLKSIFLQPFEPTTLHACVYTHDSCTYSILFLQNFTIFVHCSLQKKAVYFLQHVLCLSLFGHGKEVHNKVRI